VFGILGGIGPHPDDVAHMKRTADRLFGDQYRWSVLGAGRNQLPIAAMSARHGRQRAGGSRGQPVDRRRQARRVERRAGARRAADHRGLGLEVATPDDARRILELKGGANVAF
jgi:uncharacterized protein (DUF849 family)